MDLNTMYKRQRQREILAVYRDLTVVVVLPIASLLGLVWLGQQVV